MLKREEAYCQPCVSPVWDTVLACHALIEVGSERALGSAQQGTRVAGAAAGARDRRRLGVPATGRAPRRLGVPVRESALSGPRRHGRRRDGDGPRRAQSRISGGVDFSEAIDRGREWVLGLQSRNGGWGAFDADNTSEYLNHIPFADHGALLDPPTADVTARCASMIAQLGNEADRNALECRASTSCDGRRKRDGCWHGRWGMNYIYGTWSALCAFNAAGCRSAGAGSQARSRLAGLHRQCRRWLG